ncbi:hypothetical protein OX284_010040 [Flavobacterium sp. SUN046]|uniref:hypothetical protein n=1 Tax=Flavobacterium sp. SUN046 TaxID=3002440 RepID=UPI002DBA8A24|nr:hypothetical protein [Flavobacterium sp. SUN046]MEC4049767.1 hypothetical protein [Flavobacterium sp. SUN046]
MPKPHRISQEVTLPNSKPITQKASIHIEEGGTTICVNHNGEELMMDIEYWNRLVRMVGMLRVKAKI